MKLIVIFYIGILFTLIGCLKSDPKFKAGDCLNPVDGSSIWKLSEVKDGKMKGQLWENGKWKEAGALPDRIYGDVPCPDKQ